MQDAGLGGRGGMRAVGKLGSVRRRSQRSNFYIVFCKTGSQNNRDLMGVWAEVGKVPSRTVTQGQELDLVPELSSLCSPPWDWPVAPGQLPE